RRCAYRLLFVGFSWLCLFPRTPNLGQDSPEVVSAFSSQLFPWVVHVAWVDVVLERAAHADEWSADAGVHRGVENASGIARYGQQIISVPVQEPDGRGQLVPICAAHLHAQGHAAGAGEEHVEGGEL